MTYATLHDRLRGPIAKDLKHDLKIENVFALPRITKITVNVGINKTKMEGKEVHAYIADCLMKITGQKPVFTKTRKAISNFKTREGLIVGAMVTLRGRKMEEFLDRFVSYVLPRMRDFRGLPTKLDGRGNYSVGLREHSLFPEIAPPEAKQIFGLQVVISTTAKNDEEGRALLKKIGMPFKPEKKDSRVGKSVAKAEVKKDVKASDESTKKSDTSSPTS